MTTRKTRYAITHVSDKDGLRTLSFPNQARRHYDDQAEALHGLACFQGPDGLCRVLTPREFLTLRVDAVECHESGDAVGIFVT